MCFEENEHQWKYLDYIEILRPKGSVLGLDSMRLLMEELGHPEDDLNIIHAAGTNGKGSVFAFLASILICAGYKVGQYISPTIRCYEERFQINQEVITQDELEACFGEVWKAILRMKQMGYDSPTLFEAETAVAFLYFKKKKVDYVLLETGMGGSLDATNIIKRPLLSVITSISLDHMQFLGHTMEEIAANKAGIIKKDCPVLISENKKSVVDVLKQRAAETDSDVFVVKKEDYEVTEETYQKSRFVYQGTSYEIRLPGRHQISNAMTALKAAKIIQKKYDKKNLILADSIITGLKKCVWPGRLEILKTDPIFIRDGAHNPDGARKLADYAQKHFTNRSILYIIGVLGDKDYESMLAKILPTGTRLYVFRPDNARGLSAERLAKAARPYQLPTVICKDVKEAIKRAVKDAAKEDVIILCGSLSFMEEMGEVDEYWRS